MEKWEWHLPLEKRLGDKMTVRRILPFHGGRGIGPFVFLDHMGPQAFEPNEKFDVRPHPHIGLSTLTYLFEGEFEHKDSLGTVQNIRPGEVNWMTAGKGIVHSERTPKEKLNTLRKLHGLQAWVALPLAEEECLPRFEHHAKGTLPEFSNSNTTFHVVIGEAFGKKSPVSISQRMFYVHTQMKAGASFDFEPKGQETAFYLIDGEVQVDGKTFHAPGLLIWKDQGPMHVSSALGASLMLLGGEALPEKRWIWWNFVATSKEKIEAAKQRWKAQQFGKIQGDPEWIPLPEEIS